MIYLDSSVVLAHFLVEAQRLPDRAWDQPLTSSRLLEYEVWTRLHAKGLTRSLRPAVLEFFTRVVFVDLAENVLARARDPFPVHVRTLDALHLATIEFLRANGGLIELATFDARMISVARSLGIAIYQA
jgi:predicted nucleic acid-binding protein